MNNVILIRTDYLIRIRRSHKLGLAVQLINHSHHLEFANDFNQTIQNLDRYVERTTFWFQKAV